MSISTRGSEADVVPISKIPKWRIALNEGAAEFMGTFMILFIGNGCGGAAQLLAVAGTWEAGIVWGLGVLAGITVSNSVSGAHLNPAVTVGMAAGRRLPLWKVPHYMLGQLLGAITGAAIVYSFFFPTIAIYETQLGIIRGDPGSYLSASMFRCTLHPSITAWHGFYIEWFITAILLFVICAVNDKYSDPKKGYFYGPYLVCFMVAILVACFGPITAGCLNSFRDLGPRIVTFCAGWGRSAFPGEAENPWWTFLFAPLFGGVTGVLFWDFVAGRTFVFSNDMVEEQKLTEIHAVHLREEHSWNVQNKKKTIEV